MQNTDAELEKLIKMHYNKSDIVFKNQFTIDHSEPTPATPQYSFFKNISSFHTRLNLKSIWSMRLEKTSQLLEEGFNVFVTDIDSIWLKY